jgi:hypothetical protein
MPEMRARSSAKRSVTQKPGADRFATTAALASTSIPASLRWLPPLCGKPSKRLPPRSRSNSSGRRFDPRADLRLASAALHRICSTMHAEQKFFVVGFIIFGILVILGVFDLFSASP